MFLFTFVFTAVRFPVGIWTEHCTGDVGASDLKSFKTKIILDKQWESETLEKANDFNAQVMTLIS